MKEVGSKKISYFLRLKDYIVAIIGIIGILYMLNPGYGFIEIIPDYIPILGNLDEAGVLVLVYSAAEYFGLNIKSIFQRVD